MSIKEHVDLEIVIADSLIVTGDYHSASVISNGRMFSVRHPHISTHVFTGEC